MTQKLGLGFGSIKKACFVCGSYSHLIKDYDFHEKRMAKKSVLKNMGNNTGQREIRPVWNNVQRINHQNKFVPSAVLTRVNGVNNVGQIVVSTVKGNGVTAVKALAGCVWRPKMTDLNNVSKDNGGSWVSKRVNYIDPQGRLNFDLKNVVPSGYLTCLFAKATNDESKLWHRRLGHINFKTMNKLVKGNLVRGLPSKIFDNDHTCVACQKGKQHKASCKAKLMSSISQPLQMLHMDLFGPTSVRSINHKTYCLVVTDDFSRFSWVFFLASKDETSGILKRFITEIENQLNHKVKVIRCDNGTEFKNREMNEFCGLKGIKREFSVARTPQQNGVAERKNRTLIEAARTMLADSLLPTVFWAEAVNTACYVLNRVLVTKPHNKTPYELIIGRPPSISFMRPFGCPVTILNTLDPLGKFDGKAEEGFLVGYSVNSKAFRVFNSQTRKVEENLHVNFLENKPNVAGQGPNWLFDIDSLTNSMNYQPVTAGNQTNKNAGPQEANGNTGLKKSVDARQSEEKNVSTQQYIVFPLWSSISSSYKSSDENDTTDDSAGESPVQKPASENEQALKNVLNKMMDQEKEASEQSDAVRKEFEAQCNRELLQGKTTKASSTNSFNTVSTPVYAASAPRTSNDARPLYVSFGRSFPLNINDLPDDPLMPDLEDTAEVQNTGIFGNAFDDEDLDTYNSPFADQVMGAEADFNNTKPSTIVSPILTTRIQSIHPKDQIIGDPKSAVQTRGMSKKNSGEHAMISYIQKQKRTNHKDFQNCLFACFLSQQEPTNITQALDDESWVEAMQEELLQFKIQKVWTLVDLPYGKKAIGTKLISWQCKKHIVVANSTTEAEYIAASHCYMDPHEFSHVYLVISSVLLGLWYPKDSPFILEAFSDSDYAGASLDRKSKTGGCQFLGSRLISWQCKKQTIVANSTTEAEYIAASHYCGQVLWIQNQLLDYGYNFMHTKIHVDNESAICVIKNPVYHSKIKHIEIRHHFIRYSYEKRLIEMVKIHTDNNVVDLLPKAFNVNRFNFLVASICLVSTAHRCSKMVLMDELGLKMLFGPVLRVKHGKKLVSDARLALCC
ncbi:putative ribonuclease H-like domain-containing protein [Tanacetum coccineum]|uniref:Ribonuclease H-like domain-containing protein n=1 Tax=Tanacetum coccineum TaxID=301880 RepID=A0ABQ5IB92_9ASTR